MFVFDTTDGAWRVTPDDPSGHTVMTGSPEKIGWGRIWKAWVTATYTRPNERWRVVVYEGAWRVHGSRTASPNDPRVRRALHAPGNGLGDLYSISVSALGLSR
jgi:hypothetical protein